MRVRMVDYTTFKQECEILMQMHFLEVLAPRGYHFGMDDDLFNALGDNVRMMVAYDEENMPIGYCQSIVSDDIYDDSRLVVQTTALYLQPDSRKGMAGIKLLRAAQADLEAFCPGARWRASSPLDTEKDLGSVFKRLGFSPIERLWETTLSGETE